MHNLLGNIALRLGYILLNMWKRTLLLLKFAPSHSTSYTPLTQPSISNPHTSTPPDTWYGSASSSYCGWVNFAKALLTPNNTPFRSGMLILSSAGKPATPPLPHNMSSTKPYLSFCFSPCKKNVSYEEYIGHDRTGHPHERPVMANHLWVAHC